MQAANVLAQRASCGGRYSLAAAPPLLLRRSAPRLRNAYTLSPEQRTARKAKLRQHLQDSRPFRDHWEAANEYDPPSGWRKQLATWGGIVIFTTIFGWAHFRRWQLEQIRDSGLDNPQDYLSGVENEKFEKVEDGKSGDLRRAGGAGGTGPVWSVGPILYKKDSAPGDVAPGCH